MSQGARHRPRRGSTALLGSYQLSDVNLPGDNARAANIKQWKEELRQFLNTTGCTHVQILPFQNSAEEGCQFPLHPVNGKKDLILEQLSQRLGPRWSVEECDNVRVPHAQFPTSRHEQVTTLVVTVAPMLERPTWKQTSKRLMVWLCFGLIQFYVFTVIYSFA